MSKSFDWTEERIEQLRSLWHAGKTGTQIARTFGPGCTRSAVIGKVHRLALDGRPSPIKRGAIKPIKPAKAQMFGWTEDQVATLRQLWALNKSPVQIAAAIGGDITPSRVSLKAIGLGLARPRPAYEGQPLPMMLIDKHHCRFAVSPHQARQHLFCGAPTTPGSVYCGSHHLAAYRTAVPADIEEKVA